MIGDGRPVRAIAVRKIVTMQNRYVGDIGDYLKLGILRALSPGYRIGIAWWLYPDESHNRDGRHIGYLHRPEQWRHFDPNLFDCSPGSYPLARGTFGHWKRLTSSQEQSIRRRDGPIGGPLAQRSAGARRWFGRMKSSLAEADLVFVDPDNGLEPAGYRPVPPRQARASCSASFMN